MLIKRLFSLLLIVSVFFTFGCQVKNSAAKPRENLSVLVFITGVIAGSPTYELLSQGALEFAKNNPKAMIKIYEAGVNQAEWERQLGEMVSTGEYDVVIGSNPSLPAICVNVSEIFPNQKFIILDASYEGHPNIKTFLYNQYEQSLVLGFLAGLITVSDLPYANRQKRVGFIAAQEYPLLTGHMVPGFLEGAKLADKEIELDFRVIGSWADANKAAELAAAMMDSGVDVFTAIAGGAAQGMIKTASEKKAYVVWYNIDAYNLAPGVIVGCGVMEQKKLTIEVLNSVMNNTIQYGKADVLGIRDGYLGFVFENDSYKNLPKDIRDNFEDFMKNLL
jgi:simple sugar transport system substrate-binding protein